MSAKTRHYIFLSLAILFGITTTTWQIIRGMNALSSYTHDITEIANEQAISQKNHLDTITLHGQFLPEYVFMQPRVNEQHQPGFGVWVPFKTAHQTILISLGFQHNIDIPSDKKIHGQIFFVSASPFRLNGQIPSQKFPQTVAQLDLPLFEKSISTPLAPYVLIIDNAKDQSLTSPSLDVPLKHFSYALQFFIIACILCYYINLKHN